MSLSPVIFITTQSESIKKRLSLTTIIMSWCCLISKILNRKIWEMLRVEHIQYKQGFNNVLQTSYIEQSNTFNSMLDSHWCVT